MDNVAGGYNGRILRVNLSSGKIAEETISEAFCRKYLGGSGFAMYYLLKELPAGIDPLGPENKLIFSLGPVTGTSIWGGGRNSVGTKSPLSGCVALSEVGGHWGAELKRAGYDAVIVEGKAAKPVYLWINNGKASLHDASKLWGKKTGETQQAIRDELGDAKIRVASIGPGGENMVRFAAVMNGSFDAAGRGGTGAVMGSKNLKAIAVRGTKAPKVADAEAVKELLGWLREHMYENPMTKSLHETGTGGPVMESFMAEGNLPVRNFRDGLFPSVAKMHVGAFRDKMLVGMDACFACPVRCKKRLKSDGKYKVDPEYGGPEYETLAALGSDCGIDDPEAIAKGSELCNAYSLDTISTGGVIAFAMECFEKGLLTTKDTDGLELKFGNADAMLKCVELIARRQGFGQLLAEGSAAMAKRLGHGSEDFAIQVKGVEAGQHEPRLKPPLGLGFMVNPHGADHCQNMVGPYDTPPSMKIFHPLGMTETMPVDEIGPRKVALFQLEQSRGMIKNCLVICQFLPFNFEQMAGMTAAVTGWDTGIGEQLRVAARVLTMARAFNMREGFTADDDRLPKRFFQPKTDGVLSNKALDPAKMEKAKHYYYVLMGWDKETGVPLPEKLEELGIEA